MTSAFTYVSLGLHPNQCVTSPHACAQVLKSEETGSSCGPCCFCGYAHLISLADVCAMLCSSQGRLATYEESEKCLS